MTRPIPLPAAAILDFIASFEAPAGYDTIYNNKQNKLTKPITKMSLDELINNQKGFTKAFGSSASGRYQFMRDTLLGLKTEMELTGKEIFNANFQDILGHQLLLRRGYAKWIAGKISDHDFMLNIAKEWASFPVPNACKGAHLELTRGQSYYAGDKLNKCLVKPEAVEKALADAKALFGGGLGTPGAPPDKPPTTVAVADLAPAPAKPVTPAPTPAKTWWQRLLGV